MAIEIDGESHDESQDYDSKRTTDLQKYGIKVVRFTNDEVLDNLE